MERTSPTRKNGPDGAAEGQSTFEYTQGESVSVAIVEAVSTVEGVSHSRLEPRLYDVVDPDALDRVVETGEADLELSISLNGYRVTVFGDGRIRVAESERTDSA